MFINPLVHTLFFNFPNILVLIAFHAYTQIYRVFGPAICPMSHFISLSCPACEELGVYHVVAAHAIRPPFTWAAATQFRLSFSDDIIPTNFCLAYKVPEIKISLITYDGLFGELGCCVGIYLKMIPCGADNFIEVR